MVREPPGGGGVGLRRKWKELVSDLKLHNSPRTANCQKFHRQRGETWHKTWHNLEDSFQGRGKASSPVTSFQAQRTRPTERASTAPGGMISLGILGLGRRGVETSGAAGGGRWWVSILFKSCVCISHSDCHQLLPGGWPWVGCRSTVTRALTWPFRDSI